MCGWDAAMVNRKEMSGGKLGQAPVNGGHEKMRIVVKKGRNGGGRESNQGSDLDPFYSKGGNEGARDGPWECA
jgi:hypothetical protein